MMPTLLALFLGLSSPADAGVHVSVSTPVVTVSLNPFDPRWTPSYRAGWIWQGGYWTEYGEWVPGRWIPSYRPAGMVWVDGYWDGYSWVDGYWRPTYRSGMWWVEGTYSHGHYSPGYWTRGGTHRHYEAAERRHVEKRHDHHHDHGSAGQHGDNRSHVSPSSGSGRHGESHGAKGRSSKDRDAKDRYSKDRGKQGRGSKDRTTQDRPRSGNRS